MGFNPVRWFSENVIEPVVGGVVDPLMGEPPDPNAGLEDALNYYANASNLPVAFDLGGNPLALNGSIIPRDQMGHYGGIEAPDLQGYTPVTLNYGAESPQPPPIATMPPIRGQPPFMEEDPAKLVNEPWLGMIGRYNG